MQNVQLMLQVLSHPHSTCPPLHSLQTCRLPNLRCTSHISTSTRASSSRSPPQIKLISIESNHPAVHRYTSCACACAIELSASAHASHGRRLRRHAAPAAPWPLATGRLLPAHGAAGAHRRRHSGTTVSRPCCLSCSPRALMVGRLV